MNDANILTNQTKTNCFVNIANFPNFHLFDQLNVCAIVQYYSDDDEVEKIIICIDLYCCLLSTIVSSVNYSRDQQIVMHTDIVGIL